MNNWESLKNPPIQEAIFSITFSKELSVELLERFVNSGFVKAKFSQKVKRLSETTAAVEIKDGEFQSINTSEVPNGYRLDSNDNSQTIILKANQLSYHKIRKYDTWENSINEFSEIWNSLLQNQLYNCNTLGVRFVNVIKLPFLSIELSDFFALYPTIPSGVPQNLDGFFMTVTIPKDEMRANIIQTVKSSSIIQKDKIGIILDIDITKPIQKDNIIVEDFQELRDYKNELFFNIITEKTKKIIRNQ